MQHVASPISAPIDDVYRYFGITPEEVAKAAMARLEYLNNEDNEN